MNNKKTALIIQARMNSVRLPGKSMMPLAGEPLVGRILERVKRCRNVDHIILAVPDTQNDKILADLGRSYGVNVFCGSEDDLVDRYYRAAMSVDADLVCRLPADNATPEPSEIDRIIDYHRSLDRPGFSTNLTQIYGSGYPDGIGAEVFDFSLLREALHKCDSDRKKEHVHLNFFDYSIEQPVDDNWCPISTIECPLEFRRPELILDVNTVDQYNFMSQLYDYLYPMNPEFSIKDIIEWYDNVYMNKFQG
jgi:spore coat polysaccharide biosynthesis protein SpsF